MFLELATLGIFIATIIFNIAPIKHGATLNNRAMESEYTNIKNTWVEVFKSEPITFYASPANSGKAGKTGAAMWRLADYKMAEINGDFIYLSRVSQEEYDCDEGKMRLLYTALYEENMGAGEPLYTHTEAYAWEPVLPGTDSEAVWRIACKAKI